jgi:hypothetical protein
LLPINVVSVITGCPATLAMTMEGLEVTEYKMRVGDYVHYGRTFTGWWKTGKGFIVVEEDVVPWPGAIKQLQECEHDWCCFLFPYSPIGWDHMTGLADGLGCMKFSDKLVRTVACSDEWENRGWDELDGAVHETIKIHGQALHVHSPPVAHVKHVTMGMRQR